MTVPVDRSYWTRGQWVDDARAIMADSGSVTALWNGHVIALLGEVDVLTAGLSTALQRIAELTKDQL